MKTLVLVLLLFLPTTATAAPFLICDPPPLSEGVTHYDVMFEDGTTHRTPAPLHLDLHLVEQGEFRLEVRALRVDPLWGELESDPSPFDGARPSPPGVPEGVVLSPR